MIEVIEFRPTATRPAATATLNPRRATDIKVRVADSPFASLRVSLDRVPMTLNVRVRLGVGSIDASGLNAPRPAHRRGLEQRAAERISGDSRFATGTGKVSVSTVRKEASRAKVGAGNFSFTAGSAMLDRCSFKVATGNIYLRLPATRVNN